MAAVVQSTQTAPVPPQNLDAEESVLGAMMLSPGAIGAVSEVLDAGDFYRESHAKIYRAALRLYQASEPVDAITLADALEEQGELEDVGGRSRVHELAALVPAAANAAHYARIVHENATLRRLISAGQQIARMGMERGSESNLLIAQAEQVLVEAITSRQRNELTPFYDVLLEAWERISDLYQSDSELSGVPSGFKELDQLTAGFQSANLIVLAARPGMGKSALGLSIAANVAVRTKLPCAFFSLEMSTQEIVQRLLCMEGKVDSHGIRTGKLAPEHWSRLSQASNNLAQIPLYVDDTPGLTLLDLKAKVHNLKRREPGLGLVIVDYLQLMTTGENGVESRLQEVSAISRGLKAIAMDLDLPVLALSQLSRAVEQRHDKRPLLSDLRESGTIEQDSDVVMFIYRDDYYNTESDDQGLAEVSVAKHRNGPTDTVKLGFLRKYAKFTELP